MTNRGAFPVDPTSEVGELRIALGDTNSTPFVPAEPGYANYAYFSDQELDQLISSADGNMKRAEAYGLRKLARFLTITASSVQTDDLRVQTIDRAKLMRELANDALEEADADDQRAALDLFEIVPFGGRPHHTSPPEGMPW